MDAQLRGGKSAKLLPWVGWLLRGRTYLLEKRLFVGVVNENENL